jgi:21S rRNA (GM2251-2'-O)-methyltransferase
MRKNTNLLRIMLVGTTVAILGCRRAVVHRSSNLIWNRSFATAFIVSNPSSSSIGSRRKINNNSNNSKNYIIDNSFNIINNNNVRLWSSRSNDEVGVDDSGRRVRASRSSASSEWDDEQTSSASSSSSSSSSSRRNGDRSPSKDNDSFWDDFDPTTKYKSRDGNFRNDNDDWSNDNAPRERYSGRDQQQQRREPQGRGGRGGGRGRGRGDYNDRGRGGSGGRNFQQDRGGRNSGGGRGRGGRSSSSRDDSRNNRFDNKKNNRNDEDSFSSLSRSINMNNLENAGFVHLYGLSSVLNALATGRRDLETNQENSDSDFEDSDDEHDGSNDRFGDAPNNFRSSQPKVDVKPQAQFRPYLFVQERSGGSDRRGSKATAAQEVLKLAEEQNVPIAYVDKGILNVLSGNRPHQGFALRCGKLFFESLSKIPMPDTSSDNEDSASSPALWLVLDEVVDPQNLGALLRSAYFLGGGNDNKSNKIGVLVCSKNSAPPSATVSASSAGALEVLDVHSTNNLPRTLNQANLDGFRIIGASSSIPSSSSKSTRSNNVGEEGDAGDDSLLPPPLYDLQDLPTRSPDGDDRPILLVLGSEGHGLRTLVAKACTEFVRIPSGIVGGLGEEQSDDDDNDDDDDSNGAGVDSLNVSVTGGIMLWHLLHRTIGSD